MELKELIRQCLLDHPDAQRLLFDRFVTPMARLCIRYLRDPGTASDAMMEGFMRVFNRLRQFEYRDEASFQAWLRRIMINECLVRLRKDRTRHFMDIADEDIKNDDTSENQLSAEEILGLVNSLPDGYRTVFNLYAIDGYSHKEISTLLGISESASRSQLTHARSKLKELLYKHGWNE